MNRDVAKVLTVCVILAVFLGMPACFFYGWECGEGFERDIICPTCDYAHRGEQCSIYTCTREGWR
jgi:hypothetical protein